MAVPSRPAPRFWVRLTVLLTVLGALTMSAVGLQERFGGVEVPAGASEAASESPGAPSGPSEAEVLAAVLAEAWEREVVQALWEQAVVQALWEEAVVAAVLHEAWLRSLDPRSYARGLLADRGWSHQWECLDSLVNKESGWRVDADNPTSSAYGIPQALPGRKMASHGHDWATNPQTQLRWMMDYIKDRHGTPCGAWAHSRRTGWY